MQNQGDFKLCASSTNVLKNFAVIKNVVIKRVHCSMLCFLRSAHRLMLSNISMTFYEDILNGVHFTELQSGWHCILFLAFFTNDLTPTGR